jgi:hypothetical protein
MESVAFPVKLFFGHRELILFHSLKLKQNELCDSKSSGFLCERGDLIDETSWYHWGDGVVGRAVFAACGGDDAGVAGAVSGAACGGALGASRGGMDGGGFNK